MDPRKPVQTETAPTTGAAPDAAGPDQHASLEQKLRLARERRERVLAARAIEIPKPSTALPDLEMSFPATSAALDERITTGATGVVPAEFEASPGALNRGLPVLSLASGGLSMILAAGLCVLWLMTLAQETPGDGASLAVPDTGNEALLGAQPVADTRMANNATPDLAAPFAEFPALGPAPRLYRGNGTPELGTDSQPRRTVFATPRALHTPDDSLFDISVFIPETVLTLLAIEETPVRLARSNTRTLNRSEPVVVAMAADLTDGAIDTRQHLRPQPSTVRPARQTATAAETIPGPTPAPVRRALASAARVSPLSPTR
ncbi:MAG: hypothetical protein AAFQ51_10610 [Pseudomonadota bacterium]